tara:strand:+ start:25197 stop:25541 length:345 start_codon:yes stop_codon:yes gene_type:complete
MSIPIIKYSDKFLKTISIFMPIDGITIWPFIILKEKFKNSNTDIINHESIHIKQQAEMLVIPFYIIYLLEWFIKLFKYGKGAYNNISFEREAHVNGHNPNYLKTRKFWSWVKYI